MAAHETCKSPSVPDLEIGRDGRSDLLHLVEIFYAASIDKSRILMADKNHVFLVERTGYHALRLVEREGKADIDGLLLDQAMDLCRMHGLDEELRA